MKKLVLVTGASSGIGKSVAEKYARNGYDLILTARRKERLESLKSSLESEFKSKVHIFTFDVRERAAAANFCADIEAKGLTPDIFINNAGLAKGMSPIHEGNIDDWETMIDTNVKGFLYMARGVLPLMVKKGAGHVINIGSIAGSQVYPSGNVYNATKFAVRALSQAMNMDLLKTNIRVGSIEPGAVDTEFSYVRFDNDVAKAEKVYEGYQPLTAEDIAEIIYFMTALPAHINIQNILVTPTAQRASGMVNNTAQSK